uniref:Ribonuclease H-like domain-containing protein n=1 Tax=Tanacetum cinerariifolium TaxID=118510 RepID=A0A6L2JI99_TANCI|nr:ribonuclease H-like domain-containing protein [Tanacetum cinerariifolium]
MSRLVCFRSLADLLQEMKSQLSHTTLEWSRSMAVVKQTVDLDKESYHKLFDILKQYQKEVNEILAKKIARTANPLALVVEYRKLKRAKDYTYHKEKMLLCKQAEKGVPFLVEQANWLEDTDEELYEQELEAHYMYMAKTQEVHTTASRPSFDAEPLEKADQNTKECDDERVVLAILIAKLKLDTDENKKIQKQLKKANTSLSHELQKTYHELNHSCQPPWETRIISVLLEITLDLATRAEGTPLSSAKETITAWKISSKLLSILHPRLPTQREASGTLSNPSKTILVTLRICHGKVTQTLGMVSDCMASKDARLSKFEADFKQQQSEMTNKIDTVLKAIIDRMAGALPNDMVKNPKLNDNSTFLILSARSYPLVDPQCSSHPPLRSMLSKRRMGNLKRYMWESKDLLRSLINWDIPPKNRDEAWHAKIRLIDPDGEEFTKTLQSVPTSRKLSEREDPREIVDLDHFYDT